MHTPVLTYAAAHGGKTLFWTASDLYFAFYMNEVCGIPPAVTGLIVGASILVAALADFGTGRYFAVRVRDTRQAGKLQLTGAVASGASLLLFAASAFASPEWRIVSCIATLLLFRVAYALIDVPQNALLSMMSQDEEGRTALVASRNVTGGLARIALAAAFVPIMAVQPPINAAPRFLWLVLFMAIIVVLGAWVLASRVAGHASTRADLSNPPLTRASRHFLRMFVASASLTAFVQLEPYLAVRAIEDRSVGATFMTAVALGTILSQPLWRARALDRTGRLWAEVLGAMVVAAISIPVMPVQSFGGSAVVGLLYGMASGGLLFVLWATFAKIATGPGALATYARFTAAAKMGQALAIFAAGALLQGLHSAPSNAWRSDIPWLMAAVLLGGTILLSLMLVEKKQRVDRIS